MGAIPKQPHPSSPAYATSTQKQSSTSASSAPFLTAQVVEPYLVKYPSQLVEWCTSQMQRDLRWWPKMVCVPCKEGTNPQHLARLIAESFELPGIQFSQQEDAFWSDPPCLQCFDCPHHMPPVER